MWESKGKRLRCRSSCQVSYFATAAVVQDFIPRYDERQKGKKNDLSDDETSIF